MNALLVALSLLIVTPPQSTPSTGNVGKAPSGNVGSAPRGNVGSFPTGNVGNYPRGNVDSFPSGNVGVYPRGNVGSAPKGNVDADPTNPLNTKAAAKSKAKDKSKEKTDSDPKSTSDKSKTEKSRHKKGGKSKDEDKPKKPGVTGPIVFGVTSSSAVVIEDLERVRSKLNSVGNDYQGRRSAAIHHLTHAIHMLRFGRSDPNPDASLVAASNFEGRAVSDLSIRVAQGELQGIAARLRTNAYMHGSAAAAAVERAVKALENALRPT